MNKQNAAAADLEADVPPEMPDLSSLADEPGIVVLDAEAEEAELADAGPPPPLVPPPRANSPEREAAREALAREKTATRTGAILKTPAGTFRIIRRIAAGGRGEVFQARKLGSASFRKDVAIKRIVTELKRDDEVRKGFIDEARLAALLHHRNIASVFDLVELSQGYLLIMEYIPGTSIKDLLALARQKGATLSPAFASYIAAEVAEALSYAHALEVEGKPMGIVHRDVTPTT